MILFFNPDTLKEQSKGDPNIYIHMLEAHFYKEIPKSKYSNNKYSKVPLYGNSFLLNPKPLFKSSADVIFKVQYVQLASKRDYGLYKLYQYKRLNLSYYPDILLTNIKFNPLLHITKTEIIFEFEE